MVYQERPWVSDFFDRSPPFICPAYDLGYLVRKLPPHRASRSGAMLRLHILAIDPGPGWRVEYTHGNGAYWNQGLLARLTRPKTPRQS